MSNASLDVLVVKFTSSLTEIEVWARHLQTLHAHMYKT